MAKRNFEEVSAIVTGAQSLEDRFGKRRRSEYLDLPSIAQWRCNLTGLSQVHNLYFVAYQESIYCYIPQFPSQQISQHPALILTSPPSRQGLKGFINRYRPHAINYLVVQALGNEEVVVVARDDGDVDTYLVRHIVQAIDRRAESTSSFESEADCVRLTFKGNVGASAWGLAVHSKSRTIAVSANTHNVVVFRFALIEQDDDNADQAGNRPDPSPDVTKYVVKGSTNIPHVAFCNTGDDPSGRWLLATDIRGTCRTIDLRDLATSQTFRFGRSTVPEGFDPVNAGWGIMFLDRRSFMPETSVQAALGLEMDETLPGFQEYKSMWDIGDTVAHVSGCNRSLVPRQRQKQEVNRRPPAPTSRSDNADPETATIVIDQPTQTAEENVGDDTPMVVDGDVPDMNETLPIDEDALDETVEESFPPDDVYDTRLHANRPLFSEENNLCGDLPCPILYNSVRSAYLLQPSDKRDPEQQSPFTSPTIGFSNVLRQRLPADHEFLDEHDRLNMHAYIPSIGVVILASQKGRALVLSLTSIPKSTRYPPEMSDPQRHPPKTVYAMRIDHILPLGTQELAEQRPFLPLAGIAVGPMQGSERLPTDQKRWRLLMMYHDHSILSYEIRRQRTRVFAVDLANVMV